MWQRVGAGRSRQGQTGAYIRLCRPKHQYGRRVGYRSRVKFGSWSYGYCGYSYRLWFHYYFGCGYYQSLLPRHSRSALLRGRLQGCGRSFSQSGSKLSQRDHTFP